MKKILFVITQFYKGGAEVALLNLFHQLPQSEFEIDFLIFDQMILKDAQSLIHLKFLHGYMSAMRLKRKVNTQLLKKRGLKFIGNLPNTSYIERVPISLLRINNMMLLFHMGSGCRRNL